MIQLTITYTIDGYKSAIELHTQKRQLLKLIEEMGELTQSIIKETLNTSYCDTETPYTDSICEEYCDVLILMSQIALHMNTCIIDDVTSKTAWDRVEEFIDIKEQRFINRGELYMAATNNL